MDSSWCVFNGAQLRAPVRVVDASVPPVLAVSAWTTSATVTTTAETAATKTSHFAVRTVSLLYARSWTKVRETREPAEAASPLVNHQRWFSSSYYSLYFSCRSCALRTRTCTVWVQKIPPRGPDIFFHKRLRIWNRFFTHLLNVHIFARWQIFIQLSPILTKLCHIKRDYPVYIICAKCPKCAKTRAFGRLLSRW